MSSKSFQNASKLNGIVSVLQFGAVGDGVTDDTAAIQEAFNSGATIVCDDRYSFLCSSAITVAGKSLNVSGGKYIFTSESGLIFTASSIDNNLTLSNLSIISAGDNSERAIQAYWPEDSSGKAVRNCNINNVLIDATSTSNFWTIGLQLTNANKATINSLRINNSGTQSNLNCGVWLTGASVGIVISDLYINNASTGVYCTDRVYMVKVLASYIHRCLTCIDFNYSASGGGPGAGVLLSVIDTNLYPTLIGIRMHDVIVSCIENVAFQKQFAGTGWKAIDVITTTFDIQEVVIDNCNFGNQYNEITPGSPGDWTGINIQSGKSFQITNNLFDSAIGPCIVLASGVKDTIITDNINAQAIEFLQYTEKEQIIDSNIMVQDFNNASIGVNLATTNPPNVQPNTYGSVTNGACSLFNSTGAPVSVSNITGGTNWQIVNFRIAGANITFVNGNTIKLSGGTNFAASVGNSISFQAWPDATYGLVWRELGRALTTS